MVTPGDIEHVVEDADDLATQAHRVMNDAEPVTLVDLGNLRKLALGVIERLDIILAREGAT